LDEECKPKFATEFLPPSIASYESLGELLASNPVGLLVERDELVSLLKHLDREEQCVARGFYLSGWSGQQPYTFDRPSAASSWSGTRQVLYSITKQAMRRSADEIGATSISFRPKVFSDPASVVD
jgi:hypothetical protein